MPVAIKALKATMDASAKEEMKKEAFVMKELCHSSIVRLYGIVQSKKMNSILMVAISSLHDAFRPLHGSGNGAVFSFKIATRRFKYWFSGQLTCCALIAKRPLLALSAASFVHASCDLG